MKSPLAGVGRFAADGSHQTLSTETLIAAAGAPPRIMKSCFIVLKSTLPKSTEGMTTSCHWPSRTSPYVGAVVEMSTQPSPPLLLAAPKPIVSVAVVFTFRCSLPSECPARLKSCGVASAPAPHQRAGAMFQDQTLA